MNNWSTFTVRYSSELISSTESNNLNSSKFGFVYLINPTRTFHNAEQTKYKKWLLKNRNNS